MLFPMLKEFSASRQLVDVFAGYDHNLRIGDGSFYDMQNLTSDYYPVLSPRGPRGVYDANKVEEPLGIIGKDALCYVDGRYFVINQKRVDMGLNAEPKQLVSMGAYVIIMPDRKWYNTTDGTFGDVDAEFDSDGAVTFSMCTLDGAEYGDIPTAEPAEPENGALWIDTGSDKHSLKQWSESAGMWVSIATTYVKISCENIDKGFEEYDGITISGLSESVIVNGNAVAAPADLAALEGAAVVWKKGDGYIVVVGFLDQTRTITSQVAVSRKMPAMDFVVESGNRLWGCRYGLNNADEVVNEIYASKLGDFKNWSCYMGLATDSYAVSLGSDGQFTGAITHRGYPMFFKENCVHKMYGDYPANFGVQTTVCRGVEKGSDRSLAIVNETLFYKARSGVCAYDASLPVEVSAPLGNVAYSGAVGGAHGNKYYISMADVEGVYHLFVYDTAKGLWHKEDNLKVDAFCSCRGKMYAISGNQIVTMQGSASTSETVDTEPVEWMAQTGQIGISSPDMKYVSRLNIRMQMEQDAEIRLYARYDFSDEWEFVCCLTETKLRSFSLPIRPKRCDHMYLRIEGKGMAKIYSITKTIEDGSELS